MRHYDQPPRVITAKFPGTCKETGKAIKKGDTILYYPKDKSVYCEGSKTFADWQSAEFDRVVLGCEY